jgi:hypothetical protein
MYLKNVDACLEVLRVKKELDILSQPEKWALSKLRKASNE